MMMLLFFLSLISFILNQHCALLYCYDILCRYTLMAQLAQDNVGGEVVDLGIVNDSLDTLRDFEPVTTRIKGRSLIH